MAPSDPQATVSKAGWAPGPPVLTLFSFLCARAWYQYLYSNGQPKRNRNKSKRLMKPHTVKSKQLMLILVLWPNGTSIPLPRSAAQTHKSFWCFWIWARAFLSSSSCSCLAICKSCCTRRLRWTFVAKWCSTGNKHRQEPSNQAAELHCMSKINQVGGRFQSRKEDRFWQGNTKQSL